MRSPMTLMPPIYANLDRPQGDTGSEKKGDLRGIRIHKYKFNREEWLLAYAIEADEILLITIGCHENYYRDLKSYVK